jgi:hypothetical protein
MISLLPLTLLFATATHSLVIQQQQTGEYLHDDHLPTAYNVKVPVKLGVMSQCPDAILCEGVIDDVLKHVANKVHLSLSFIGRCVGLKVFLPSHSTYFRINTSEPDYGVTCLHGAGECAGNVQQLCASKYEPLHQWWRFVKCQNKQGRENVGRPEVALQCAEIAGFDWNRSETGLCAGFEGTGKGEEGLKLLRESVKASQALGIRCVG